MIESANLVSSVGFMIIGRFGRLEMKLKVFFDDNYLAPFKTFLYSAYCNKKPETKVEIVVGLWRGNLSPESIAVIMKYAEKLKFDISFETLGTWAPILEENIGNPYGHIPADSAKARLEYFVTSTGDFIYIDVDILLLPGWDEIFQPQMFPRDHAVAAVPDSMTSKLNNVRFPPAENKANAEAGRDFYFNCGFMIVNSQAWHESGLTEKLTRVLEEFTRGDHFFDWVDQDALNLVTADHKKALDRTFNTMIHPWTEEFGNTFFSPERSLQPKILHFVGAHKPWNMDNELREYLLRIARDNYRGGFIDAIGNWYHMYFFHENQRILWEQNWGA